MESPNASDRVSMPPRTLWAAITPRSNALESLHGERRCDVAIIGGGFMGLSAALDLAEASVDVVLVEAAEIGWGASGRNNGLVVPGLKRDPHEVQRLLGDERADRLLRLSGDAPQRLFDLIDRLGIDCDLNRRGWIQAAHARSALPLIDKRLRAWQALGADVALIPEDDVPGRLGTDYYFGAWYDPRGGSLNPLAYARGLAEAARDAGADIHERSPALNIDRDAMKWRVTTSSGVLIADAVLCCTNAYNHAIPEMRGAVIPLRTAQVASAPLAEAHARTILPRGESASDTQRLLTSFRLTADNRLIMGGASATAGDGNARLLKHLHRAAQRRFPDLDSLSWQYGWSGYLALTQDHLPRIFNVADGFHAGIGCNGRGIAMATVVGVELARIVRGVQDCDVPVHKVRRVFGFSLRHPGVAATVFFKRTLDSMERRLSRRPGTT